MTAPSKTFSAPTDAQINVDSPIDATLMTQIRDALIHLEEWIGKDYTAATNHNHDGVNSASLDIGTDTIRNGSFETNSTSGWTETLYTGGTIATGTAGAMDGAYCAEITTTVALNGGGDLVSSEVAVTGGQVKQFRLSFSASAITVASSAVVQWLDGASAQISESTIYTTTDTPTTARLCVRRIEAPANARFCKVKLSGGKTAAGGVSTGTGTIYFDGVTVENPALLGGVEIFTASGTFSAVWGDVEVELVNGGTNGTSWMDSEPPGAGGSSGAYSVGIVNISADTIATVGGIGGVSSFSTISGGSGGSINIASQPGESWPPGGGGYGPGGAGASSRLGTGGLSYGKNATGYGSGGGGGASSLAYSSAGSGSPGVVIVRW